MHYYLIRKVAHPTYDPRIKSIDVKKTLCKIKVIIKKQPKANTKGKSYRRSFKWQVVTYLDQ
jgi:hypothetical protein